MNFYNEIDPFAAAWLAESELCGPHSPQKAAPEPCSNRKKNGVSVRGCDFVRGFWRNAEWINCRDGLQRPIEPGVSPLAYGSANRVGRLRGYGNAIVAPVAEAFIRAYLETEKEGVI